MAIQIPENSGAFFSNFLVFCGTWVCNTAFNPAVTLSQPCSAPLFCVIWVNRFWMTSWINLNSLFPKYNNFFTLASNRKSKVASINAWHGFKWLVWVLGFGRYSSFRQLEYKEWRLLERCSFGHFTDVLIAICICDCFKKQDFSTVFVKQRTVICSMIFWKAEVSRNSQFSVAVAGLYWNVKHAFVFVWRNLSSIYQDKVKQIIRQFNVREGHFLEVDILLGFNLK